MLSDLLSSAPPYKLLNVGIGSAVLLCCLAALLISYMLRLRESRALSSLGLPPLPAQSLAPGLDAGAFPHLRDYLLLAIIASGFFLLNIDLAPLPEATPSADAPQPPPADSNTSIAPYLSNIIFLVTIYLPFALRWLTLPAAQRRSISVPEVLVWIVGSYLAVGTLAVGMTQFGVTSWLIEVTQSPELQEIVTQLSLSPPSIQILIAISAIIVAPIGEELMFRGYLFPMLKPALGRWGAILLSSLFFGIFHMALIQTPMLTLLGVIFCLAYERTQSLWLPILLHACFNAANVFFITQLPS